VNVKRYFGRTNKEAMAKLRAELGPEAIVLKNQAINGGVEILAMPDDAIEEPPAAPPAAARRPAHSAPAVAPAPAARPGRAAAAQEAAHASVPEMSTLSFQQYVRDRLAQKLSGPPTLTEVLQPAEEHDEIAAPVSPRMATDALPREALRAAPSAAAHAAPAPLQAQPTGVRVAQARPAPSQDALASPAHAAQTNAAQAHAAQAHAAQAHAAQAHAAQAHAAQAHAAQAHAAPAPARPFASQSITGPATPDPAQVSMMAELREMRSFIAEQLGSLSYFDGIRRNPLQSQLLRQMLSAGFSPALSRQVVSRIPADFSESQATTWLRLALARNLRCDAGGLLEQGGIFALVGPTGVGKTTSTAKIAARFALRHGTQAVGLVTVDAYRIGGQDQLRTFGRMLGVPVHVAHDAATLADFLHLYMNKKLVLIDTAGIGQRDERVDELMASLSSPVVRKLVVLNAAAQAETLDDVVRAYRAPQAAGVVISKVDEAVKLGGVLDCALRHRLKLIGVANGQRVPEDWVAPQAESLVDEALSAQRPAAFEFDDTDLSLLLATSQARAGSVHA